MARPIPAGTVASVEGGSRRLPAGNYACTIVAASDNTAKEYVLLTLRVAAGERTGYEVSYYLSYKDNPKVFGMTLGRLNTISESNPGFDAEAAWNANTWPLFLGKSVGVQVNEEEWQGDDGKVRTGTKAGALLATADVLSGKAREPRHRKLDGTWVDIAQARADEAAAAVQASTVDDDDIPF